MQESLSRSLADTIEIKAPLECHLEEHVWKKMMGWCKAAKSEVSGMGLCVIEKGVFRVYDVFFPLQYDSTGYTELDDRALAKLQIGLYKKKVPSNHFRFWWHTHYNFNVFWSGTDDDNATTLAKANGDWELSLVINQAGEFRCRADFFKKVHKLIDEKVHVLVDEIKVYTVKNSRKRIPKRNYKNDIKRWVKSMADMPERQKPKVADCPPVIYTPGSNYNNNYLSDHYDWNTAQGEFGNYWEDDDKPVVGDCTCGNRFCWSGRICGKKKQDLISDLPKTKLSELKNGDKFGDFIFFNSLLLSKRDYAAAVKDTPAEVPETCKCGDEMCANQELCVHCSLCDGRCQAATGYCPGCVERYETIAGLSERFE